MVSVPSGAYAYDAQNRLVSATVNGVTTEFTYDSRNRVVRRTSGNGTLSLTYSGWHLIEERNVSGALEQVYVHGAGTDEILVKITGTGPAYYHHDGLGSTIALTGENGALLESYRYDAFGAASVYDSSGSALPASPRGNRFLFTGREWLSQVGLYDYRNRVYSAQIGRFLQTDPIRFAAGDANIYRYCGNEPINWFDPMGLCSKTSNSENFNDFRQVWDALLSAGPFAAWDAQPFIGDTSGAWAVNAGKQATKDYGNPDAGEAIRHEAWQSELSRKFGEKAAKAIGDSHERRSPDARDSSRDQFNNKLGRERGNESKGRGDSLRKAKEDWEKGRAAQSKKDPRL
jgi:RHS repeat-associated protein